MEKRTSDEITMAYGQVTRVFNQLLNFYDGELTEEQIERLLEELEAIRQDLNNGKNTGN